MKKLNVKIKTATAKSYPIFIGSKVLGKLNKLFDLSGYSKVVVITDKSVEKNILHNMPDFLPDKTFTIVLPVGERTKHIGCVIEIWKELTRFSSDRKTLVINIGGGVILDLGGFAASTYMRGIDFINVPTTLLSMVDASIGGKTGINFEEVKNLIGTFNQPKGVVIDTHSLQTLPDREFISGFGEIIKHGLIANDKYFEKVVSKKPREFSGVEMAEIIFESCKIKSDVIQKDEKEQNTRKILNFGHTVGHAVEILSHDTKTPLLHGEAIAIGIVIENDIAVRSGLLTQKEAKYIEQRINQTGLPTGFKGLKLKSIIIKMKKDKKNQKGIIRFTLLKGIGNAVINQIVDEDIIDNALESNLL